MERLTKRNDSNTAELMKCGSKTCPTVCDELFSCIGCPIQESVDKLAAYEDAEEQGLLLKLPCKCQEVVWVAQKGFKTHKAFYASPSAMLDDIEHGLGIGYTSEEAEAALERMG